MNDLKIFFFNSKKSFLIGIILGLFGLHLISYHLNSSINLEELALGEKTSVEFGVVNNYKIHCHLKDIDQCIATYIKYGENLPVTLWLGNSQLHAINYFKPGDKPSSVKLHRLLKKKGQFLITFSQPNANLQEHLILTSHLIQKLPIENIILPVVFDDMREINIRFEIANIFSNEDTKNFLIKSSEVGAHLYENYLENNPNSKLLRKDFSIQDIFEKKLSLKLEKIWPLWSNRPALRGKFFSMMYKFRNYVFQINSSTEREMIPGHYIKNFSAIENLIEILNKKKIKTLVYIAPIRNDFKIPYKLNEYNEFKKEIKILSKKNNINFKNFENLIPNLFWGEKDQTIKKELDFMHFKASGHDLFANTLYEEMILILNK